MTGSMLESDYWSPDAIHAQLATMVAAIFGGIAPHFADPATLTDLQSFCGTASVGVPNAVHVGVVSAQDSQGFDLRVHVASSR